MGTASRREQLLEERRKRVFGYFKSRLSLAEIMQREGIDERTAKELRREARRLGHPSGSGRTSERPFGLTQASESFRVKLGSLIFNMMEKEGKHQLEISRDIGITQKTAGKMRQRASFPHDWKVSEIERLAVQRGVPFRALMLEMLKPSQFATKQEKDEWNALIRAASIG